MKTTPSPSPRPASLHRGLRIATGILSVLLSTTLLVHSQPPATRKSTLKPAEHARPAIQMTGIQLDGVCDDRAATFTLKAVAKVTAKQGGFIPLLSGDVALLKVAPHPRWKIEVLGDTYQLAADRMGDYPVELEFQTRLQTQDARHKLNFRVAPGLLHRISLRGLPEDTRFEPSPTPQPWREGDAFISHLPANGEIDLTWSAIRTTSAGRLFFSAETVHHLIVSPGLARQNTWIDFKIMQGEVRRLTILLSGAGEITRVQGDAVLAWTVAPAPTNQASARWLTIDLNQPKQDQVSVQIQSQAALGVFPHTFAPLRMQPEGATRFAGYIRVVNDGAIRLEIPQAKGMSQVSPEQIPSLEAMRNLPKPSGTQHFAFRCSGSDYDLQVLADHIMPEVSVSQLQTCYLGDSDVAIESDLELDVREAPLRELQIQLPSNFALAKINATGMSDHQLTSSSPGTSPTLRILYEKPVSGRQVVQLRLERNTPLGETSWALPRIDVLRARAVRGHVGVAAELGLRLTAGNTSGLTELATGFYPKKVPGLQLAYRISEPLWQCRLAIEHLSQSIQSDAFHLFSVSEGIAYGSSLLQYMISGAPVSTFHIELSPEYFNIEFTGREIRHWQKNDRGGYQVQLHSPVSGNYTLLCTYERPFKAQGESLSFTGARPLDVQSEQGHTLLISAYQFEVTPATVSSNLLALEPGEVPSEYRLFFDTPIIAAYRYIARPFDLKLNLRPLTQGDTIGQIIDRASTTTRVSSDGQVLTDTRYFVKNKGTPHLRVALPADAQLWSVTVNGSVVVPVAEQQTYLIPLPQRADPNTIQTVEMKLASRHKDPAKLKLAMPSVQAPVLFAEWRLEPETGRRLHYLKGTLNPSMPQDQPTGFERVLQLFRGDNATRNLGCLLSALGLILIATVAFNQALRPAETTSITRLITGGVLGALALTAAFFVFLPVTHALTTTPLPAQAEPLRFVIPVQQPGSTPAIEIANLPSKPTTWMQHALPFWAVLPAIALWASASLAKSLALRLLMVTLGWTILFWAAMRSPQGAPLFFLLILGFLAIHVLVPYARLFCERFRSIKPARSTPAATIASLLVISLLASNDAHGQTTNLPLSLAQRVSLTLTLENDVVQLDSTLAWNTAKDQFIPLPEHAGVLTSLNYPVDTFQLIQRTQGETTQSGLQAKRSGSYEVKMSYRLQATRQAGETRVRLPDLPGLIRTATIRLKNQEADVRIPAAISVQVDFDAQAQQTVATAILSPTGEVEITCLPRSRDTRKEKTVFYTEIHHLYSPSVGLIDSAHQVLLRPAQGEIREVVGVIPSGMTVSDVTGNHISVWRFDPDSHELQLTFDAPQSRAINFIIHAQTPTGPLPYEHHLQAISIRGAATEIGLIGMATGAEVQLDDARGEELSPLSIEDFPVSLVASERGRAPGLVLRRAFRFTPPGKPFMVKASAVEPDVRVESQQTLSLAEDRLVLAANLSIDITRAGLFRLAFPLPDGLEVESLTGPAVSHWTDLKSQSGRLVTIHLKSKTEGQTQLAITLSGPGLRQSTNWQVPRLMLREASKQRGQLTLIPELGMRLQVVNREGVTQLDPARSGIRQKGVLAFRLLQEDWALSIEIQQVESWIQALSLQDTSIAEGQIKVAANLQLDVENTGIKQLQITLPETAESVRIKGEVVADFRAIDAPSDPGTKIWEIKLQRRTVGRLPIHVTYQVTTPGRPDHITITSIRSLDANLQRGFLTLRAHGRLQLRVDQLPASLQAAEWQSIPRNLMSELPANTSSFTYRLVDPHVQLPVTIERRDAARLLPARVNNINLTSIISDDGVMLTQTRIQLSAGDKRLLQVTLPPSGQFWFAFVNQKAVWPWREQDRILIPLEPNSRAGSDTTVELFHTSPCRPAQARELDLSLAGPKFDLPLEAITWRVFLDPRWTLRKWEGTLQLEDQTAVIYPTSADLDHYLREETSLKQQQIQEAEQFLNLGNNLIQQGDPQQARRAFQMAYGLSQHDAAFNEDARVQLHNLKTQQALIGLNVRNATVAGDASPTSPRLPVTAAPIAPNYTQDEAKKWLERNSAEETAAQTKLAERLVMQQDAAAPNPAGLRASLPELGKALTFRRSLLVDPWASLELKLEASATPATPRWASPTILILATLTIALLLWQVRQARHKSIA